MILTLTFNPTIDAASEADTIRPTRKIRTHDESFHPGGGGINVARVIHRLGGTVEALFASGGAMGQLLNRLLDDEGITYRVVNIAGNTRINNIVYEKSTGLEYRFVDQGPSLQDKEWAALLHYCETLDWNWLVVSGSLPHGIPYEIYDQLIDLAKKRGCKIAIDTSDEALFHVFKYGGATLIKPSQSEFEAYTGKTYQTAKQLAEDAQRYIRNGIADLIAVTLGHQGAILATSEENYYLPAPRVRVQSASGAGDSFVGGMVYALANEWTMEDAFRLATACGTAAVAEKGTEVSRLGSIRKIYRNLIRDDETFGKLQLEPSD